MAAERRPFSSVKQSFAALFTIVLHPFAILMADGCPFNAENLHRMREHSPLNAQLYPALCNENKLDAFFSACKHLHYVHLHRVAIS